MAIVINLDTKNNKTGKPSYDDVLSMANALNKASSPEKISDVLKTAALAQFDPVAVDLILVAVQAKTKLPKKPLRQRLQQYEQELGLIPNDLALDIARKIRNEHFNGGAHLVRCADASYWCFVDTHWRETTGGSLRRIIMEEANKVFHLFEGNSLPAQVSQAKTCLDDLLGTDEDVMGFNDEPSSVVNCANGEVWVGEDGTVELMPHRPESRLTYCLQIDYDLSATCPTYDKALLEIFSESGNPGDLVRHWNEFMGYAIQPRRDIPSYWILIGHGSNGKSKLLETLQRLVGRDAVLNDQISSFQRDRFNVAALSGKLLFIDDDLAEEAKLADDLLKKISEAKEISARHAYGRRKFKFRCLALPIMAGNTYPLTNDSSWGMVRRAQIIPFDRIFTPEEADPNLFPEIWKKELSGILNRSLEGLQRLRKRGGFKMPEDCEMALKEFMAHANPLIAFIEERCVDDPEGRTPLSDFREAMKIWAKEQGTRRVPADKRLKRKLEGLNFEVKMVKGYNKVYGLLLKS